MKLILDYFGDTLSFILTSILRVLILMFQYVQINQGRKDNEHNPINSMGHRSYIFCRNFRLWDWHVPYGKEERPRDF